MEFHGKISDVALTIMYPAVKVYLPDPEQFRYVTQLALRDDPNKIMRRLNERLVVYDKHGETIVCVDECKRPFTKLNSKKLPSETLAQAVARVERSFSEVEHVFSIAKGDDGTYDLTFYSVSPTAIALHEKVEQDMRRYQQHIEEQEKS